ncbi:MAG: hypothetical protein AABX74_03625 [Nanoarchaeota archaeon]
MAEAKISAFEIVLLVVGIAASFLGFHLINRTYNLEKEITWMMIIAIFNWLMLLVLFVLLSLTVDTSKKQLAKMEIMVYLLSQKKSKK